jgi:hypothetical protein
MVPKQYPRKLRSMKMNRLARELRRESKREVPVVLAAEVTLKEPHPSSHLALLRTSLSDRASLRSMWSRKTLVI